LRLFFYPFLISHKIVYTTGDVAQNYQNYY
jgi:hypothetical protein